MTLRKNVAFLIGMLRLPFDRTPAKNASGNTPIVMLCRLAMRRQIPEPVMRMAFFAEGWEADADGRVHKMTEKGLRRQDPVTMTSILLEQDDILNKAWQAAECIEMAERRIVPARPFEWDEFGEMDDPHKDD